MRLIAEVDQVFEALELPLYHSNPLPHMSIGFVEGSVRQLIESSSENTVGGSEALSDEEREALHETVHDEHVLAKACAFELANIVVQCGKRVEKIPL